MNHITLMPTVDPNLVTAFSEEAGRAALEAMVELAKANPLFCIPADAANVWATYGADAEVVVLGTSLFSHFFITEAKGYCRILAVVDDFKAATGAQFENLPIIDTATLISMAKKSPRLITINGCKNDYSRRYFKRLAASQDIACVGYEQALRLMGICRARDYRVEDWASVITSRLPEFLKLADRMQDVYSRQTLYGVLLSHLSCNPEWMLHVARPYSTLYFRSGLWSCGKNERFVDCGASIAESSSALVDLTDGQFERIWMIEPDRSNVKSLNDFVTGLGTSLSRRISVHACAVGDSNTRMAFRHEGGHGGSLAQTDGLPSEDYVDIVKLDDLLDEPSTLIKMDIEGAELTALEGASQHIREAKPKLALSAYHRATDLLDLTAKALQLNPDYRVGLRHHTELRWDTCVYFY